MLIEFTQELNQILTKILMSIINNLVASESTRTLTLGSANLAKLTDDQIAIAVNKGWTVS